MYDRYVLDTKDLNDIMYIYPETIYEYFVYEIKFYAILNEDNIDDREELYKYFELNYTNNRFCGDIKQGFILKSIKEDNILITIFNKETNKYVGIITCKDLYPKNEFVINLLCSSSKDKYDLNYSFGLLLQHILINYIYDSFEKDNENDDIYSVYLNAFGDVHKYYLKLGYEYGKDCSNKHEYIYSDEYQLYPMKLCNLKKTLNILYDKILIRLEDSWLKLT